MTHEEVFIFAFLGLATILAILATLYWLSREDWTKQDREIRELYSDKHK